MDTTETMRVFLPQVAQAPNDKPQLAPMLEQLKALPEEINQAKQLLTDAGDRDRMGRTPPPLVGALRELRGPPAEATPVERMTDRLKTPKGRAA